jgi:hypothetical protein
MNVNPTGSGPFAALRAQLAQKTRAAHRASATSQAAGAAPRIGAAAQGATAPSPLGAGAISALAGAGAGPLSPPITSRQPLTVDGLLQEWGQRDSRYDFDRDGTVNMGDLLILLARQSEQTEEPAPPEPGLGPTEKEPDLGAPGAPVAGTDAAAPPDTSLVPAPAPAAPTVDGLLAAWGSADTTYDLDSSGTVDMADLLALLSRFASARAESHDAPTTPSPHEGGVPGIETAPAPALASGSESSSATPGVDGLLEAWGERGSQYDLDGNGVVNMRDLILMLSRLAGREAERSERSGSRPGPGAGAGPFGNGKTLLDRLAARAGGLGIDIRG